MVLCLGQFFTSSDVCEKEWKDCLEGRILSPVPLYILGPLSSDQETFYKHVSIEDGGEMCSNITYLGELPNLYVISKWLVFMLAP